MSKSAPETGKVGATGSMTTREIWEYLAKQQALGWPGSLSIHPYGRHKGPRPPLTGDKP